MSEQSYKEPLGEFLKLELDWGMWELEPDSWMDYVAKYNLDESYIPDLIRLLETYAEPSPNAEIVEEYAAVHAWRTLGQLKAAAAIPTLIDVIHREGWEDLAFEEIPHVFAMIGTSAIAPLQKELEKTHSFRIGEPFATGLTRIAIAYPSEREHIIGILADKLKQAQQNEPDLNGFVVAHLIELKATEAIDAIRACYEGGHVDEMICGTLQEIEVALGLREPDEVTDSLAIRQKRFAKEQAERDKREGMIARYGWHDLSEEEIDEWIQQEKARREKQKRKRVQAHKTQRQNRKKSKKKKRK
jgi:hypothetical protein